MIVPTLIGMTFLIFTLIAASPGGIGTALAVSGGGQMDSSSRAAQQAYLEDRYGLDQPLVVQYFRWLGRVSPVKFGVRDQLAPGNEVVRPPRRLKEPPLRALLVDGLPEPEPEAFAFPAESTEGERAREYRLASNAYARARFAYLRARSAFELAVGAELRAAGLGEHVAADGRLERSAERAVEASFLRQRDPALLESFAAMMEAYAEAAQARERLAAVFRARPFPEAGVGISGLVSLSWPDLGRSYARSEAVSTLIARALPVTLLLNLVAFPIIYLIAIPTGMLAAARRGSWFDVGSGALFVALWSVPVVWAGVLAMGYLANQVSGLGAFPVAGLHSSNADAFAFLPGWDEAGRWHRGYLLDTLWHIVLPVACLVYSGFAILSKQTRAAMLDNFSADYVRTAKAKGVSEKDIVFRHVFRNSLLPLITMFVSVFPLMLGGSVVVERIFSVPGMGSLILEAIYLRDREVLLANAMIVGLVNMLALLLADILYALADPRISYK